MTPADVERLLTRAATDVPSRWPELEAWLHRRFGREPELESILFLVGVQSRGMGYSPHLEKDEKQDLIMLGSHVVLGALGIYRQAADRHDDGDWLPVFDVPELSADDQEMLLKLGALRYFEQFMDTR